METEATQPPSGAASAATGYPRWVLLQTDGEGEAVGSSSTADAMTLATARTSSGRLIGVSLRLAVPPAVSSVCIHFPRGVQRDCGYVVAAHGDSVLIHICFEEGFDGTSSNDYFVYSAGNASAEPPRLPTLSLLPPFSLTKQKYSKCRRSAVRRYLPCESTGLLRRGEDEIAVAELQVVAASYGEPAAPKEAELLLLRSNRWSVVQPPIRTSHGDSNKASELLSSWSDCTVLNVGDELLCWVDLFNGLLLCNVFDESPVLQHVPLPAEAARPLSGPGPTRSVCVTAGNTLKFVNVVPRCCCGGAGSTNCQRSRHAYTINTWKLRMDDDMIWEMDGMVDATELWALDEYKPAIPRVPLLCPIVSMDDPHVISFLVCEWFHVKSRNCDETGWLVLVNTRTKAILSVYQHFNGIGLHENVLPSRISYYLNSNPHGSEGASAVKKDHMDVIPCPSPVIAVDASVSNDVGDSARSSAMESTEPSMQASSILAAFQEIPSYGLHRDDMLKAYSILSQSNGGRLRSLLGLPKNLRKDWLLMEIKATEG